MVGKGRETNIVFLELCLQISLNVVKAAEKFKNSKINFYTKNSMSKK